MFNSFIYAQYNNMKDYFLLIYGVLFLFNIIDMDNKMYYTYIVNNIIGSQKKALRSNIF